MSGYLKTFFGSLTVLRISVAEQARFKDPPAAKKPAAAEEFRAPAKVFELNDVRAARPVVPTVTMEVHAPRTDATGAFRMNETGSFKPNATGSFKAVRGGSQKVLTPTLKPAAKSAALGDEGLNRFPASPPAPRANSRRCRASHCRSSCSMKRVKSNCPKAASASCRRTIRSFRSWWAS